MLTALFTSLGKDGLEVCLHAVSICERALAIIFQIRALWSVSRDGFSFGIISFQVENRSSNVSLFGERRQASTAFGGCRGGSEDQLLVSVGSVLGGSTWEEAPFIN